MESHNALSVLAGYGFEVLELIPGEIQRVQPVDGKRGNFSGWYIWYTDPCTLVYGDWRFGQTNVWRPEGKEQTREEAAIFSKRVKQAKAKAAEVRVKTNVDAAIEAMRLWKLATPTDDHPYLETKMICANTAKVLDGVLLIPLMGPDGKLKSLQQIYENGQKRFLAGGQIKGCFTVINGSPKTIYLCEGYATGETIHAATGCKVYCALTAGNLKEVAIWISEKYPCNELVICADDDHETEVKIGENPGIVKAQAAAEATGATVIVPTFKDEYGKSDFNDILLEDDGAAKIEEIVFNRPAPTSLIFDYIGDVMSQPLQEKDWLIKDLLQANTVASLYAPSGSCKSFLAIDLSLIIACGLNWLNKPVKQGKVMYLCGEGADGIRGRLEAWQHENKMKVPGKEFCISRGATMIDDPAKRKKLIARIRKERPELLVVDTLRRNFSGSENDSKEVSDFVAAIDEIKNCCRCTVLVVAHTGKDLAKGEMGSVVLRNSMDTRIRLVREDEEENEDSKLNDPIISVIVTKQKDGKEGTICSFTRKLWKSDKLKDYTSLTLKYTSLEAMM